jgi:hypothetical protein
MIEKNFARIQRLNNQYFRHSIFFVEIINNRSRDIIGKQKFPFENNENATLLESIHFLFNNLTKSSFFLLDTKFT